MSLRHLCKKITVVAACGLAVFFSAASTLHAQDEIPADHPLYDLNMQEGPGTFNLGQQAKVTIPAETGFLNGSDTAKLMVRLGNPKSNTEQGSILNDNSIAVFEFDDIGYVKDDEKDSLDPDELLEALKEGTLASNAERKKMGAPAIYVKDWYKKPYYNPTTHNLEWIVILTGDDGGETLNVNTRILGRKGVMVVTLIVPPEYLEETLPVYNKWLSGFEFTAGNKYAEFRDGDHVAEYGLAALITGGAAVALAKGGFFKAFWKLIVAGVVAIGAALKKFFGNKKDSEFPRQ